MTPDPAPGTWDACAWDSPSALAAPTASPAINRLLRGAWLSPPFTPTTRDALVAQGRLVPAPELEPIVATPNDWKTTP